MSGLYGEGTVAVKNLWRRFRGLPTWVQVVSWVGLVLVLAGIGNATEEKGEETVTATASTTTQSVVTLPVTTAPATTVVATTSTTRATTTTTTTSTTVPGPRSSFGTGTHRVGVDIVAGTYTAPGGSTCYWARLSGFGGGLGEIIANNLGGGSQVVTIAATDAGFESRSCGTWTRQ